MTRFLRTAILAGCLSLSAKTGLADDPSPAQLLEKAVYTEQTIGDLRAALKIYEQIVSDHEKNTVVYARAKTRLQRVQSILGGDAKAKIPLDVSDAVKKIREYYVNPVTIKDGRITKESLREILSKLDVYSSYIDSETLKNLYTNINGEIVGIGAVLDLKDGNVTVVSPLPGSPALAAGLKANDTIVSIDGLKLASIDEKDRLQTSLKRLRGKANQTVTVEVNSVAADQPKSIRIVRGRIELQSVSGVVRNDANLWQYRLTDHPEIGYIRIRNFAQETAGEFKRIVHQLEQDRGKGLVIDLRNCTGGLLVSAVEIADVFLAEGLIVENRGRTGEQQKFAADSEQRLQGIPIVVLVNQNTASSAEVMVGALKENERALVVGARTYGKGSAQGIFPLPSGGAMKLTTSHFFLRDGVGLEKPADPKDDDTWGVNPSDGYEVQLTEEQRTELAESHRLIDLGRTSASNVKDPALEKAIEFLNGH